MKSSIPLYWRLRQPRYRLVGTKCTTCGSLYFPPRPVCLKCRKRGALTEYQFSGQGKVISWTVIHIAPEGFEAQTPYTVGIIELEGGVRISGQIIANGQLEPGRPVTAVFRRIYEDGDSGLIHYGLKWQLAD